jgi:hypothetical protein
MPFERSADQARYDDAAHGRPLGGGWNWPMTSGRSSGRGPHGTATAFAKRWRDRTLFRAARTEFNTQRRLSLTEHEIGFLIIISYLEAALGTPTLIVTQAATGILHWNIQFAHLLASRLCEPVHEIESALLKLIQARTLLIVRRREIVGRLARSNLPAIYSFRE